MLKLKVEGQLIYFAKKCFLASDSKEYIESSFEFDEEWEGFVKTAIFYQDEKSPYHKLLDDNNSCIIPYEALSLNKPLFIGIFGVKGKKRITTNLTNILVETGSYGEGLEPSEPTEDIYEQIINLIEQNSSNLDENYYKKNEVDAKLNNKVDKIEGKGLSTNDLTNQLKSIYDDTVVKAHVHSNKTILDNTTASYTTADKNKLANLENYDDTAIREELNTKANKNEIPTSTSDLTNNSGFITNVVNDLTNYYLKTETYSKTEVNNLIGDIVTVTIEVVEELPANPKQNVIYFIVKEGTTGDIYNEYMWVNNTWELIGTTEIDLTGYATETWVNQQISGFLTSAEIEVLINTALTNYYTKSETNDLLNNKVDKVEGKGLSERDFSSAKDDKLSNIEDSADRLKYTIIPDNPNYGDIIQYTGEDTDNFKHGHFYEYVQGNPISANIVYESETITNVSLDDEVFATMVDRDWVYNFRYLDDGMGAQWLLGQEYMFDLIDYGIIYEGEPEIGDIITVNFETEKPDRWVEAEVQTGMQFKEMPVPNNKLNEKIIQYIGDKFIDSNNNEYIQGHFYKCSFQYRNQGYQVDPTVDENTVGEYYTRRGINRYTAVTLPDQYVAGTVYYKSGIFYVYTWQEVVTGQVIQYDRFPEANEDNVGTVGQYIGIIQGGMFKIGSFYRSTLIPPVYNIDPTVDENTVGTYYRNRGMGGFYVEVTLPDQYVAGTTYYAKTQESYYDWVLLDVSYLRYNYIYPEQVTETAENGYVKVEVSAICYYEDEINVYPLFDNELCEWWKENFIRIEYVYENGFSFILKENLPAEYTLKYTRVPSQYDY